MSTDISTSLYKMCGIPSMILICVGDTVRFLTKLFKCSHFSMFQRASKSHYLHLFSWGLFPWNYGGLFYPSILQATRPEELTSPGNSPQPAIDGNCVYVNVLVSLLFCWNNFEACILYHPPEFPRGNKLQSPT